MQANRYSLLLSVIGVASLTATAARAEGLVVDVQKNDGNISTYRLTPVQIDATHAPAVARRQALSRQVGFTDLPASHQIAHNTLPPVRDQGYRGTCAYFATVGLIETYYQRQSTANQSLRLSEECLTDVRNWMAVTATYTEADKPSGRPDDQGDLPGSVIQTVSKYGLPAAKSYGSGASAVSCVYNPGDEISAAYGLPQGIDLPVATYSGLFATTANADHSLAYGKGLTFDQNTAPTVDAIRTLLAKDIPVEVGIIVYNQFMSSGVSDWRYVSTFNDGDDTHAGDVAGGHAVMLTGYTTTASGTIFTFRNSWDTTWGVQGFGTMNDKLLLHGWSVAPNFDAITSLHPGT